MLLVLPAAYARERAFGYCEQGGHVVVTQGLNSDTKVQQSFPSCTVTVYNEGTTTLSNIYADNNGTVKGNPFTSDANGYWFFYANNGRYDVDFSNSDITNPYAQGDYLLCDPSDPTGSFSCTGSNTGLCPLGPTDTRYVDSTAGSDSNIGRNWCSAYATEQAAVTALASTGGWIYVAPDYTGAAPASIPANVHILQTNQFDAIGSSVRRLGTTDWTADTEDTWANFKGTNSTAADLTTLWDYYNPFGSNYARATSASMTTIPSTSSSFDEGIGSLGSTLVQGQNSQGTGVEGICSTDFGSTDCTGVVGVAAASTAGASGSHLEAGWFQPATASGGLTNVDGLVVRAVGGFMPTTTSDGELESAALDIRFNNFQGGNAFPYGVYIQNSSVLNVPVFIGITKTIAQPHWDVYTTGMMTDEWGGSTTNQDVWSVVSVNNNAFSIEGQYQKGNILITNTSNSAETVIPTSASGTVSVDAINTVTFSATPIFDRSLGKVQTITLTGNVTGSTLQNCVAGQTILFDIIEDGAGAHTFSAPANLHGFGSITTTANYHNRQVFYCTGGSSNSEGYSVSAMQSGT